MTVSLQDFSFSGLSGYSQCPKAFEYRYVLKEEEAFSGIEAWMGSAVHKAIEKGYRQMQAGVTPGWAELLSVYGEAWEQPSPAPLRIVREQRDAVSYRTEGEGMLHAFWQRVLVGDKSTTLALESSFTMALRDGVRYRGVIDRVAQDQDGRLLVVDFKTGRVGQPTDTLQLPSYALYMLSQRMDEDVRVVYEDLRSGRTLSADISRRDLPGIRQALLDQVDQILQAEHFPARPSTLCLWCGFSDRCPHARNAAVAAPRTGPVARVDLDQKVCPRCGGDLQERKGRFGTFIGCRSFPTCRYTRDGW